MNNYIQCGFYNIQLQTQCDLKTSHNIFTSPWRCLLIPTWWQPWRCWWQGGEFCCWPTQKLQTWCRASFILDSIFTGQNSAKSALLNFCIYFSFWPVARKTVLETTCNYPLDIDTDQRQDTINQHPYFPKKCRTVGSSCSYWSPLSRQWPMIYNPKIIPWYQLLTLWNKPCRWFKWTRSFQNEKSEVRVRITVGSVRITYAWMSSWNVWDHLLRPSMGLYMEKNPSSQKLFNAILTREEKNYS